MNQLTDRPESLEPSDETAPPVLSDSIPEERKGKGFKSVVRSVVNELGFNRSSLEPSVKAENNRDIDSWATRLGATAIITALGNLERAGTPILTGWGVDVKNFIVLVMTALTLVPLLSFNRRVWDRRVDKNKLAPRLTGGTLLFATIFAAWPLTFSLAANFTFGSGQGYLIVTSVIFLLVIIGIVIATKIRKKESDE